MSDCCAPNRDSAGTDPRPTAGACPDCATKAKPVSTLTVKNLARDHTRVSTNDPYWFCRTPDCEVVYFSCKAVFRKSEVKVRVGLKESEDPIPVCYCFGYERAEIRRDIESHGNSAIPNRIKAEVQAGFCACEVKNPSGKCCLGDLNRDLKELKGALETPHS